MMMRSWKVANRGSNRSFSLKGQLPKSGNDRKVSEIKGREERRKIIVIESGQK